MGHVIPDLVLVLEHIAPLASSVLRIRVKSSMFVTVSLEKSASIEFLVRLWLFSAIAECRKAAKLRTMGKWIWNLQYGPSYFLHQVLPSAGFAVNLAFNAARVVVCNGCHGDIVVEKEERGFSVDIIGFIWQHYQHVYNSSNLNGAKWQYNRNVLICMAFPHLLGVAGWPLLWKKMKTT